MPGSRGGKSRTTQWRLKRKKLDKAIARKHQRINEAEEDVTDSSSDESQSIDHNEEDSEAAASSIAQHGIVDYPLQKEGCDQSPTTKSFQQQQDYTMEDKQMIHESDASRSDSDSDEEIEECFAYFLEEDQENNENSEGEEDHENVEEDRNENYHGGDPDPDDPEGDINDPSSESESEDELGTNFDLDDAALNAPLHPGRLRTKKEALLLQLTLSLRHSWDYESLIDNMKAINLALGRNNLPTNKKQLWRILHRNSAGIHYHAYCHHCLFYVGRRNRLPNPLVCGSCDRVLDIRRLRLFVTLSVKKQLEHFLAIPGAAQLLQYRDTRIRRQHGAIEDVIDGEVYQRMRGEGGILANPMNFSYILNSDGLKLGTSAHTKIWVFLLRLNELPPNLRQKHMFLAGIWVGKSLPNANIFLARIVRNLNRLSMEGINWSPNGGQLVNSKFVPLAFSSDAEARALFMNMQKWNGGNGCTFCLYQTVNSKYPVPEEGEPWPLDRTHDGMIEDMTAVPEGDDHFRGHKGPTELMNLKYFDLRSSNAMDDLHPVYLGVVQFHTELLLHLPGVPLERRVTVISHRLSQIRPTKSISRKPVPFDKRAKFHGTEWRNWLLFYGLVCLRGLVPDNHLRHFEMLSHSVYLLSLDSVTDQNTNHADALIENYVRLFQQYHGVHRMRYNVHALRHLVRSVREIGPLWCSSTFNFESWNHTLLKFVTSPKDCIQQITTRHLLCALVYRSVHNEDFDEDFRNHLQSMLSKTHKIALRVGSAYVLGKATRRQPTLEEANLMQREGFNVQQLATYDRVMLGGVEYYDPHYNEGGLSDNTLLFTYDNTFCAVQSIAVIENAGREECILFVHEFTINETLNVARHIAHVRVGEELPHIVPVDRIKCPATKLHQAGDVFIVPLANCKEID